MARFQTADAFHAPEKSIQLLPFRFERKRPDEYLVSNMVGDFARFTSEEFARLNDLKIRPGDGLYERAYASHLITREGQTAQLQVLATRLRSRMAFLREPSALHMFVVTLRCEHSCPYCQVSRQSTDRSRFDMSEDTARRALAIAFQSPARRIKIDFVIATNLALLNDAILKFCKENSVLISTSLDGPADLHDKNRPRPGGNSHELAVKGIKAAQAYLGMDRVGALMTTTEGSLGRVKEIVDEYTALGLDGIFLRPLSPYGFAVKTKQIQKYDAERWLEFYRSGLRYILDLNRDGRRFFEFYTLLLLKRMMTDKAIGYVDLRSPAGIGLGALVYNYDGKVFASDEGRMLAEMGDKTFELGHVNDATYRSLIMSDKLVSLIGSSLSQCAPECHSCVYESHCGADPVYHHATQGDALGMKPLSGFCTRQKGVVDVILDLLENSPDDARVLREWGAL